jgi:hypothetical protein
MDGECDGMRGESSAVGGAEGERDFCLHSDEEYICCSYTS